MAETRLPSCDTCQNGSNLLSSWKLQPACNKPWITEETKELIKTRDNLKKQSEDLASAGDIIGARTARSEFKNLRKKINNKKKYEEKNFKSQRLNNAWTLQPIFGALPKVLWIGRTQVVLQLSLKLTTRSSLKQVA